MQIESDKDFPILQQQFADWRKRFPMFKHDVIHIENAINSRIKSHSIAMVNYRQTHKKNYLEQAKAEITSINQILLTVEKLELMALLAR